MMDVRMANDLVLLGTITIFDEGLADVIQGSGRPSSDRHPSGQTVLLTETDGRVHWPSNRGLCFRDTRLISAWAIYANLDHFGEQPSKHANRVYGDGQCARKKS